MVRAASAQPTTAFAQTANQVTATDAALVTQLPVLQQVIKDLGLADTPDQLRQRLVVAAQQTTNLIDVAATDPSPQRAADVANKVMTDFVANFTRDNQARIAQAGAALETQITSLEQTLAQQEVQLAKLQAAKQDSTAIQQQIQANGALLAQLTTNYSSFQSQQAEALDSVAVASPAVAPLYAASPQRALDAVLGALGGLFLGLLLAASFEYFDQGLRNPDDVRDRLGLATLAVIPRFTGFAGGDVRAGRRSAAVGEAYRRLRTNIMFAAVDHKTSSVLLTSVRAGEGKTRTAANLAAVMAAAGQQVLLVDADMRRPDQHRLFGRPLRDGLSELLLLSAHGDPPDVNGTAATSIRNLSVLSAGTIPPNPSELLAARHTAEVVRHLERAFDLVVFDTPPCAVVADALNLAPAVAATVLVIEVGRSNARDAAAAIDSLRSVGANVIGVVLNKAPDRGTRRYGDYYGAYGPSATVPDNATFGAGGGESHLTSTALETTTGSGAGYSEVPALNSGTGRARTPVR